MAGVAGLRRNAMLMGSRHRREVSNVPARPQPSQVETAVTVVLSADGSSCGSSPRPSEHSDGESPWAGSAPCVPSGTQSGCLRSCPLSCRNLIPGDISRRGPRGVQILCSTLQEGGVTPFPHVPPFPSKSLRMSLTCGLCWMTNTGGHAHAAGIPRGVSWSHT